MTAYLALSSFLVSLATLFFFVAVLLKGVRQKKNLTFCVFAISVFVWSTGYMYWQLSGSEEDAIFWLRILVMGSSFIPYTFLHFVTHFVGRPLPRIVLSGYLVAIILNVLAWTPYIFSGVEARMGLEFWPVAGVLFPLYFGGFLIVVSFCFVLLFDQYRKASIKVRNQNKYLIIGTAIGFFGGGTNFPLWVNIQIPPVLHGLSLLYILGIGYSVLKYRLLDFNEMVIRLLGLLFFSVFFGAILAALFSVLMGYAYPGFYPSGYFFWWMVFAGLSVVYLVISPVVRDFVIRIVEARLESARFAYRQDLRQLSDEWISNIQSEESPYAITEGIYGTMHLDYAALYIRKGMETDYRCEASFGARPRALNLDMATLDPLISAIFRTRHALFLEEEVERSPAFRASMTSLCATYPNLSLTDLIVPVLAHDSFYGFLVLGSSSLYGAFADVDLLILENLCSQYALALKSKEVERRSNQVEKLVSLGTMAAGLSHELRNPLVSVRTLGGLLKKASSAPLSLNDQFSQTIQRDIKRISGIVDGVAAFAQNENRPMGHVTLAEALLEAKAPLEEELKQKRIEWSLEVEEATPCALANFDQLVQVFFNIYENAINALSEWEKRPEPGKISVCVSAQANRRLTQDKWVEIRISDNGPGMSAEFQASIFDPFVTSRDTGQRDGASGTGLGLAIVKKIIEYHNGKISVDASPSGGASFLISIPSV